MFEEMRIAMNVAEQVVNKVMDEWSFQSVLDNAQKVIDENTDEWDKRTILEAREYVELASQVKALKKQLAELG